MVSRLDRPNPPCVKKERNFKEVLIFSADFFTRSFQQIFSADLRSRFSSADVLSRSSQQIFSQQIFSADLLSRFFQQIFSADLLSRFSLSRFSQQIFSADFLSRSSQQIFSADFLSRSSQQIFSADLLIVLSFAVVRGCHLLWSGVGGQLLSYHLLWSGVGGQLLSYHVGGPYCMSSLEGPFRGAFGKKGRNHLCFQVFMICPLFFVGFFPLKTPSPNGSPRTPTPNTRPPRIVRSKSSPPSLSVVQGAAAAKVQVMRMQLRWPQQT